MSAALRTHKIRMGVRDRRALLRALLREGARDNDGRIDASDFRALLRRFPSVRIDVIKSVAAWLGAREEGARPRRQLTAVFRALFIVGPAAIYRHLASVRFAGTADAREDGIETDALVVEVLGAAELRVDESTIGELTLLSSGAAEIDFSGSLVSDAHLDMAGASELDITMNGGVLSGRARGAGDVTY